MPPRFRVLASLATILLCACAGAPRPASDSGSAERWIPIFNGRDDAGWRANRTPGAFRVTDGVLRVNALEGSSHLFYVGEETSTFKRLRNFELELEVRGDPSSNSGIYVHSDPSTAAAGGEHFLNKGYEIQLNNTVIEKKKTGSLYGIVDLDTAPVDDTKWFTMRIRVDGKRIGVWTDGRQVVDYLEPDSVQSMPSRASRRIDPNGGGIAIQAHDPKSVWYFRSIRLRRLP